MRHLDPIATRGHSLAPHFRSSRHIKDIGTCSMPNTLLMASEGVIESGTPLIEKPFENASGIELHQFPNAIKHECVSKRDHQLSEATLTQ